MNVDTIVDGGVGMYRRATNLKNNTSTIATKKKVNPLSINISFSGMHCPH